MELTAVLQAYPKEQTYLLEILLKYQASKPTHHLEEDELTAIADHLGLPASHVFSVVSFYSFFSMTPRGRYILQFCRDVPCHISDTFSVRETLETLLGIKTGETTEDGVFTLEYSSCLGACDLAPVLRVNDTLYHHLTVDKIKAILAEIRSGSDA